MKRSTKTEPSRRKNPRTKHTFFPTPQPQNEEARRTLTLARYYIRSNLGPRLQQVFFSTVGCTRHGTSLDGTYQNVNESPLARSHQNTWWRSHCRRATQVYWHPDGRSTLDELYAESRLYSRLFFFKCSKSGLGIVISRTHSLVVAVAVVSFSVRFHSAPDTALAGSMCKSSSAASPAFFRRFSTRGNH